jgi:phytoene dehydrogenase-like protein
MNIEHVHNLVIGSGVGGKILTWTLAKQGQKTVVIERSMVGGSCPNVACLPSKNVIYSAKAVSLVHPTRGLGVVRPDGNARRHAVHRAPRRDLHPPDRGRRISRPVRKPSLGPAPRQVSGEYPDTTHYSPLTYSVLSS